MKRRRFGVWPHEKRRQVNPHPQTLSPRGRAPEGEGPESRHLVENISIVPEEPQTIA